MKIGIDISQIVYEGTGVAQYVRHLVSVFIRSDKKNTYVLFGASLRRFKELRRYVRSLGDTGGRVRLVAVPIPPTVLEFVWNRLHVIPVETFVGPLDIFWSSDWTQPPLAKAHGVTTLHDVSILRTPESYSPLIVSVQKRRLMRAKAVCLAFLCDSEATKKDAQELLGLPENRLFVVYPGFSRMQ